MSPTELNRIASEEASYLKHRKGVPLEEDDLRQEAALAVLEAGVHDAPLARIVARRRLKNYCRYQRSRPHGMVYSSAFVRYQAVRGRIKSWTSPKGSRSLDEKTPEGEAQKPLPKILQYDPRFHITVALSAQQVLARRAKETGYVFNQAASRQAREAYLKASLRWYAKNPRPFD